MCDTLQQQTFLQKAVPEYHKRVAMLRSNLYYHTPKNNNNGASPLQVFDQTALVEALLDDGFNEELEPCVPVEGYFQIEDWETSGTYLDMLCENWAHGRELEGSYKEMQEKRVSPPKKDLVARLMENYQDVKSIRVDSMEYQSFYVDLTIRRAVNNNSNFGWLTMHLNGRVGLKPSKLYTVIGQSGSNALLVQVRCKNNPEFWLNLTL
jgi:hypothetical protein